MTAIGRAHEPARRQCHRAALAGVELGDKRAHEDDPRPASTEQEADHRRERTGLGKPRAQRWCASKSCPSDSRPTRGMRRHARRRPRRTPRSRNSPHSLSERCVRDPRLKRDIDKGIVQQLRDPSADIRRRPGHPTGQTPASRFRDLVCLVAVFFLLPLRRCVLWLLFCCPSGCFIVLLCCLVLVCHGFALLTHVVICCPMRWFDCLVVVVCFPRFCVGVRG